MNVAQLTLSNADSTPGTAISSSSAPASSSRSKMAWVGGWQGRVRVWVREVR